jgi:hypothetical protein
MKGPAMTFRCLTLAFLATLATPAFADEDVTDTATGTVYALTLNDDGTATLASKVDEIDSFALKSDCYAEHPIYGLGAWQAVDGGWRIMVQGSQIVSFEGTPPLDNPACVPQ